MNLFISLYDEQDPDRLGELMECFAKNQANPLIKGVYILNEGLKIRHAKQQPINHRATYRDFYRYISTTTLRSDINIIANSDIFFDETLELAHKIKHGECWAICRQDMPVNYWGSSQDVWIFRGPIHPKLGGNFPIGFPGCDNRLGFELDKVGYVLKNPCEQLRCWHNHEETEAGNWYHSKDAALLDIKQYNGTVEYDAERGVPVVRKPYRAITPCQI